MKSAQTSDRISSLAGKYQTLTADRLVSLTETEEHRRKTAAEIRSMAASLLRQDETRGLRKLVSYVRKVTGQ